MPYASLSQAKPNEKQSSSRIRQEWLVSISTGIICVWPSHFSSGSTLINTGLWFCQKVKQEKGLRKVDEMREDE